MSLIGVKAGAAEHMAMSAEPTAEIQAISAKVGAAASPSNEAAFSFAANIVISSRICRSHGFATKAISGRGGDESYKCDGIQSVDRRRTCGNSKYLSVSSSHSRPPRAVEWLPLDFGISAIYSRASASLKFSSGLSPSHRLPQLLRFGPAPQPSIQRNLTPQREEFPWPMPDAPVARLA